jgi:predicted secreted hydrolase
VRRESVPGEFFSFANCAIGMRFSGMKPLAALVLCLCLGALCARADWLAALPGWHYEFPRDHGSHPDFKTEWWYFTGNLSAPDGRKFGYELTFFRQGLIPPGLQRDATSRFVTRDLKFAHFAVSDISGKRFYFTQKISRGAYGEAGFDDANRLAWIENWELARGKDGSFLLRAAEDGASLELRLVPQKPPAIHGEHGVSQKAPGAGHASHYYSLTDLRTDGVIVIRGQKFAVAGTSWFDHEWATNQLAPEQAGWDWLGLHLDDGRDLMLYRMRRRDGSADSTSSGTLILPDGSTRHLAMPDFSMKPLQWWTSPATHARYPIGWEIVIPSLNLDMTVRAAMEDQELALNPIAYWEGAVTVSGRSVSGEGYLELAGYGGGLVKGLSKPEGSR